MITTDQIKSLRDETGVSVMQCKQALEEAEGDREKALIILRKKSSSIASKKANRDLKAGTIAAYIHAGGTVGAMVELLCETDFVAKNEEFQKLAYDIAMHIAATSPEYLNIQDITEEDKQKVREVFEKNISDSDKSDEIKNKILQGKLDAHFKEKVLLEQSFIKNPDTTISELVEQAVQKFGEKSEIGKFTRFAV